jgi:D-threo-aldose 1-dehydrogenase
MSTRRDFLNLAVKGSAMTAAAAVLSGNPYALLNPDDGRSTNMNDNAIRNVHYKLPFKFGLGGVPLGNEFAVVTDKDAYAILEAAWTAGIRYYDVSPWYGLGLAERRFGSFLHNKNRSEYVNLIQSRQTLKGIEDSQGPRAVPFLALPQRRNF